MMTRKYHLLVAAPGRPVGQKCAQQERVDQGLVIGDNQQPVRRMGRRTSPDADPEQESEHEPDHCLKHEHNAVPGNLSPMDA